MIPALPVLKHLVGSKVLLGGLICLGAVVALKIYVNSQWRAGYEAHKMEMAEAAAKAERLRIKDETRLQGLSDFDLCSDYLRARGVSDDACTELRRLPIERSEPGRNSRFGEGGQERP